MTGLGPRGTDDRHGLPHVESHLGIDDLRSWAGTVGGTSVGGERLSFRSLRRSRRLGLTIADLEREVRSQPEALERALAGLDANRLGDGSLLVGAGDSYAAAVCASQLSSLRVIAQDPLALLDMADLGERSVCIVSVSGRTRTNLDVARVARANGRTLVAITADERSPLARLADRVVTLPYRPVPRTPGMLSFTLSLLALLKMALPDFRCDFRAAFQSAVPASRALSISRRGTTFMLGNRALYGVSIYGAAKVYELLGRKAQAEQLEQFGHMEVFSLSRSDSVNVLSGLGLRRREARLHSELAKRGYTSRLVQPEGKSGVERLFSVVFAVQLAVIGAARREGIEVPSFLRSRSALAVSDGVIY